MNLRNPLPLLLILAGMAFAPPAGGADRPFRKVLFLGNSITKHGPSAGIGWTGDWGMAASEAGKDYVHLVVAGLAKSSGQAPEVLVKNIADFERDFAPYDFAAKQRDAVDFHADLIILAIGENVPALKSDGEQEAFEAAVTRLLTALKGDRAPAILVRGGFWANAEKDAALRAACAAVGGTFVDIGLLGKDEANYARSERDFQHAGVANHPGDRGMAAIAGAILGALSAKNP
jgi:alpha-galactosidase